MPIDASDWQGEPYFSAWMLRAAESGLWHQKNLMGLRWLLSPPVIVVMARRSA